MNILREIDTVEETKHLVPNLESFSKAVFGGNSFFLDCQPDHMDWATGKIKRGDGLVWLPWESQLWLTEVEWEESSNFFDQSRAFARGKIDIRKFEDMLKKLIQPLEHNLDPFFGTKVRGEGVMSSIVEQTLNNHIKDDHLEPHGWVLLGHHGANSKSLREKYVKEVSDRFRGKQHYIVTMVRMFTDAFSTYFLLEHSYSSNLIKDLTLPNTTLVQGKIASETLSGLLDYPNTAKAERPLVQANIKPQPPKGGRAKKIYSVLKKSFPQIDILNKVRVGFSFARSDMPEKYFEIDWDNPGEEFLLLDEYRNHNKPANLVKRLLGDKAPKEMPDVCQKYGSFYDASVAPPELIVTYARVAKAIKKGSGGVSRDKAPLVPDPEIFFSKRDPHTERMKRIHIVEKRKLWEVFLVEGALSNTYFKEQFHLKDHDLRGFQQFLTDNGITTRRFDDFTLGERTIHHIRKILDDHSRTT
jgi:hypothetical protein